MSDPSSFERHGLDQPNQAANANPGEALKWILGSTATVIDIHDGNWSRTENVNRVAIRANEKIPTAQAGSIPPRVAKEVLDKAIWADTAVLTEYLAGVLASSRTPQGERDQGVTWASMIGRLSSDQLALHWVLYTSAQKRCRGSEYESVWEVTNEQVLIDVDVLLRDLGWPITQWQVATRLLEAAYGLEREGLLTNLSHGGSKYLGAEVAYTKGHSYPPNRFYLTFAITPHGIGLLLQALGIPDHWLTDFINREDVYEAIDSAESLPQSSCATFVRDYPAA